jgi:hypothetical protein
MSSAGTSSVFGRVNAVRNHDLRTRVLREKERNVGSGEVWILHIFFHLFSVGIEQVVWAEFLQLVKNGTPLIVQGGDLWSEVKQIARVSVERLGAEDENDPTDSSWFVPRATDRRQLITCGLAGKKEYMPWARCMRDRVGRVMRRSFEGSLIDELLRLMLIAIGSCSSDPASPTLQHVVTWTSDHLVHERRSRVPTSVRDTVLRLTIDDNFQTSTSSTVFHAQLIVSADGELRSLVDRVKRAIIEQIATETEAVYSVRADN